MSDPQKYERTYSFTDFQAGNPSAPLPGIQVDNEMENIEQALGGAIDAIKDVRRSDGKLKNGIVTVDSLDPQVAAGVGSGALASAAAAAASANAAADSAEAAASSAGAASGYAGTAATSAGQAMTFRNEASGSADDATAMAVAAAGYRDFAAAWATAAEGVDVDDGVNPVGKSSYHWAQVALGAATGALPDGSVTETKLADGAVTEDKLSGDISGRIDYRTPEGLSETDVYAAAQAAAIADKALFLDGAQRTTTSIDMPADAQVFGPGAANAVYQSMRHSVGVDWDMRNRSSSLFQARITEAYASAATPQKVATWARATGTSPGTGVAWEAIFISDYQDGAAVIQSGALARLWPRKGKYKVEIRVDWDANIYGIRAVCLAYNSGAWSSEAPQDSFAPNPEVGFKTTTYSTFYVDVEDTGDYLSPLIYMDSGNPLDYTMDIIVTPLWVEPALFTGDRLLIFQGLWDDKVTAFGGLDGLTHHVAANYDTLILSNLLPYNDDSGLFPQTPNKVWYNCIGGWPVAEGTSVTVSSATDADPYTQRMLRAQDANQVRIHDTVEDKLYIALVPHTLSSSDVAMSFADFRAANPTYYREAATGDLAQIQSQGWPLAQQFIRGLKALRPDIEIFFYIPGVGDVAYWDNFGNPRPSQQPYDGSRGYGNVISNMIRYDRLYPEASGYFFDHTNPTFMTGVVLVNLMYQTKIRGKKAAVNTISIGEVGVNFAADCRLFGGGDALVFEGYYRDNGADVEAATYAANAAIARLRARGVRLFAVCEEATEGAVIPGSVNDLNARSIFEQAYIPGDAYQHSWPGYTTM